MARKRKETKSAFDNTSKEELQKVGKEILKKAEQEKIEPVEEKKEDSPTPLKKPVRKTINRVVYLSEAVHKKARIQAVMSDMTIKEYVSHLIERDSD